MTRPGALLLLATLCAGCSGGPPEGAVPLVARKAGGAQPLPIVLRDAPSFAERTAATELAEHLRIMTGLPFAVVGERRLFPRRRAIHVGATRVAESYRLRCDDRGPEGWIVATAGRHVVLCGGRPRGTLYAVYHLLEDDLGVRWWSPFDRDVPHTEIPRVPRGERSGAPAFAYRDLNGVTGDRVFGARSRLNGHFTGLREAHGGSLRYGPPSQVHNFFRYVPPEQHFDEHPEFFSEVGGLRFAEETQLCLTDEGLLDLVLERLDATISAARDRAAQDGVDPPQLYDFSQNDWGRPCECERCTARYEEEASRAAPLVTFVNRLAEGIATRHPEVRLGTLAYGWSIDPPRGLSVREGVIVRVAPLYGRDFSKPLSHRVHERLREALRGWRTRVSDLRIWDYVVTFGDPGDLPLPNLDRVAADLRFYRDLGVEGVFLQQDPPVAADVLDLKRWVLVRLLEDPDRDVPALVREFTEGYYGPAGEPIRRYRALLADAVAARPVTIPFDAPASAFDHLGRETLPAAQALFDEAERRVADDPVRWGRVRHARLALDAATLHRWGVVFPAQDGAAGLERSAIVERWRATFLEQLQLRLSPVERAEAVAAVAWQVSAWTAAEAASAPEGE